MCGQRRRHHDRGWNVTPGQHYRLPRMAGRKRNQEELHRGLLMPPNAVGVEPPCQPRGTVGFPVEIGHSSCNSSVRRCPRANSIASCTMPTLEFQERPALSEVQAPPSVPQRVDGSTNRRRMHRRAVPRVAVGRCRSRSGKQRTTPARSSARRHPGKRDADLRR